MGIFKTLRMHHHTNDYLICGKWGNHGFELVCFQAIPHLCHLVIIGTYKCLRQSQKQKEFEVTLSETVPWAFLHPGGHDPAPAFL